MMKPFVTTLICALTLFTLLACADDPATPDGDLDGDSTPDGDAEPDSLLDGDLPDGDLDSVIDGDAEPDSLLDGDLPDGDLDSLADGDIEPDSLLDGDIDIDVEDEIECRQFPIVDVVQQWPVPPTGQTECYGAISLEADPVGSIPCPTEGEALYGQDAQYPDNIRTFTESEQAGDVIVTDSLTGLIWAKDYTNDLTLIEALDYCEALDYAGYTDWRLPNIHELQTVVHLDDPFLLFGADGLDESWGQFPGEVYKIFWTSTPIELPGVPYSRNNIVSNSAETYSTCSPSLWAFVSDLDRSFGTSPIVNSRNHYARCVRGEPSVVLDENTERFSASEPVTGETVTSDAVTGLVWVGEDAEWRCWDEALAHCENLDYAGYTDWRLPNIYELTSLVNFGKDGISSDFPSFPPVPEHQEYPSFKLWTSTSLSEYKAYMIDFLNIPTITDGDKINGNIDAGFHCAISPFMCVRGGP